MIEFIANATDNAPAIGYATYGNGPEKVIVLHDWNGDHRNWAPVTPYLNPEKFTYAFMDARGQGLSLGVAGNYTVTEIAEDVFKLAEHLNWNSFSLIGHSFTTLSAQIAHGMDRDNRIKSTLLICGFPASGSSFSEEEINFFNGVVNNRPVTEQAMSALTGQRYVAAWNQTKAQVYLETSEGAASKSYLDSFANRDYSKDVVGLEKPVLVVTAEFDYPSLRQAAVKAQFDALNYRNIQYVDIQNSGHYPNEETPVYLATVIENFLSDKAG